MHVQHLVALRLWAAGHAWAGLEMFALCTLVCIFDRNAWLEVPCGCAAVIQSMPCNVQGPLEKVL
jgi:hypothetical protein